MKAKIKIILYFLFISSCSIQAFEDKKIEELIKKTRSEIYSNPSKVIQLGDSLYYDTNVNLEDKINALLMVSDAYISIRNYPIAIEFITKAKNLVKKNTKTSTQLKVWTRLSYQYFQLGFYDESLRILDEVEQLNQNIADPNISLDNIGYVYAVRGLVYREIVGCEIAMRYFEKAIESYLLSKNEITKINLSTLHYNIGNCLLGLEEYDKALLSFNESFLLAKRYGYDNSSLTLYAEKGMANVYTHKKEYGKAISKLFELISNAKRVGDQSLLRSALQDLSINFLAMEDWNNFSKYNKEYMYYNNRILNAEKHAAIYNLTESEKTFQHGLSKMKSKFYLQVSVIKIVVLFFIIAAYYLIHFKNKKISIKKEEMLYNL